MPTSHESFPLPFPSVPGAQAPLIAAETAVHEAVLQRNSGCYRATREISLSVGLTAGDLALQRAAEKGALHEQGQPVKAREGRKATDSSSYAAGFC